MENHNDKGRFVSLLSDYGFKVTFGNESDFPMDFYDKTKEKFKEF